MSWMVNGDTLRTQPLAHWSGAVHLPLYTYADLQAAYDYAWSEGFAAALRPGQRPPAAQVVDLAEWKIQRAGKPCAINPTTTCTGQERCGHLRQNGSEN